jgi:multiple sugar transport system substrate-binding protein
MRNWPYAAALIRDDPRSPAAGHFALAAMPHDGGRSASVLGGAQLAINARSRQPNEAWELVRYLTSPEQMVERARVAGQFPPRPSVYEGGELKDALPMTPAEAKELIEQAVLRPTTPVYTQLSGVLQVHLHRALTRQEEPDEALSHAAKEMRQLLTRARLLPSES